MFHSLHLIECMLRLDQECLNLVNVIATMISFVIRCKKNEKLPTLKSILHVLGAFSYSVMILNVPFGQVSFFVSTTVVEHMFDDFV